jgi:hypothetical protein
MPGRDPDGVARR